MADTYRPSVLEMGYAESLFVSLLKVLRFSDPGVCVGMGACEYGYVFEHKHGCLCACVGFHYRM